MPDQAELAAFATRIQAAIIASGRVAPPIREGLGFWNRPAGLMLLGLCLALTLPLAVAGVMSLGEGSAVGRSGQGAALAILLPVGAGWLLLRSWRRRRAVLAALR